MNPQDTKQAQETPLLSHLSARRLRHAITQAHLDRLSEAARDIESRWRGTDEIKMSDFDPINSVLWITGPCYCGQIDLSSDPVAQLRRWAEGIVSEMQEFIANIGDVRASVPPMDPKSFETLQTADAPRYRSQVMRTPPACSSLSTRKPAATGDRNGGGHR